MQKEFKPSLINSSNSLFWALYSLLLFLVAFILFSFLINPATAIIIGSFFLLMVVVPNIILNYNQKIIIKDSLFIVKKIFRKDSMVDINSIFSISVIGWVDFITPPSHNFMIYYHISKDPTEDYVGKCLLGYSWDKKDIKEIFTYLKERFPNLIIELDLDHKRMDINKSIKEGF